MQDLNLLLNLDFLSVISNPRRKQILHLLEKKPQSSAQIISEMTNSSYVIKSDLRILHKSGLIEYSNGSFYSNPLTRAILIQNSFFEFFNKNSDYYLKHTLGDMPEHLRREMGVFQNAHKIDSITPNIEHWKKIIKRSKKHVQCIFTQPPILIGDALLDRLQKGIKVSIIFGKNSVIHQCSDLVDKLKLDTHTRIDNLNIRMSDKVLINTIITEKESSIMFPNRNGIADMHVSYNDSKSDFLDWSNRLFHYKWNESENVGRLRRFSG